MLGTNNQARFQTSTLRNIQTLQTSISTKTVNLQQQITAQEQRLNLIDQTLGATGSVNVEAEKERLQLQNVDNTRDSLKPVSTATQNALNLKQNLLSETVTLPQSYVAGLLTTISNMNASIAGKASKTEDLIFDRIKQVNESTAMTLTSVLSSMQSNISTRATTSALSTTNNTVTTKADKSELIFEKIKASTESNAISLTTKLSEIDNSLGDKVNMDQLVHANITKSLVQPETLDVTFDKVNEAIALKADKTQLTYSGIVQSSENSTTLATTLQSLAPITMLTYDNIKLSRAGDETLTHALFYLNRDKANKSDTISLIYDNIKKDATENAESLTKTLSDMTTAIAGKATVAADLIYSKIKETAGSTTTLTTTLQDMEVETQKKELAFNQITVNYSLMSSAVTISVAMKNQIHIYRNTYNTNNIWLTSTNVTIPSATSVISGSGGPAAPSFQVGDFYHFIIIATSATAVAGRGASPANFQMSVAVTDQTMAISFLHSKANGDGGTSFVIRCVNYDGGKKWVRII
jgi:hypothetical protein